MPHSRVFQSKGRVRTAVKTDLPFIQEWLQHEVRNGIGFIKNWGMIQNACAEKRMTIFINIGKL